MMGELKRLKRTYVSSVLKEESVVLPSRVRARIQYVEVPDENPQITFDANMMSSLSAEDIAAIQSRARKVALHVSTAPVDLEKAPSGKDLTEKPWFWGVLCLLTILLGAKVLFLVVLVVIGALMWRHLLNLSTKFNPEPELRYMVTEEHVAAVLRHKDDLFMTMGELQSFFDDVKVATYGHINYDISEDAAIVLLPDDPSYRDQHIEEVALAEDRVLGYYDRLSFLQVSM